MTVTRLDSITHVYRDPTRSLEDRLEGLLAMMTREEKVAQLGSVGGFQIAEHGQQRMFLARFGIPVSKEKQHGQIRNAPPQKLNEIQGCFVCPVNIFKDHNGGA